MGKFIGVVEQALLALISFLLMPIIMKRHAVGWKATTDLWTRGTRASQSNLAKDCFLIVIAVIYEE